jgi:serine/threonine protein kinase
VLAQLPVELASWNEVLSREQVLCSACAIARALMVTLTGYALSKESCTDGSLMWRRLLTKDPRKRPDARDALGHPWLKVTSSKSEAGDAYMQSISNEVIQNLSVFVASNKLQRAFMHLAACFMHKSEMHKTLTMFNTLNTDRTTPMPAAEISALLCKGRKPEEVTGIQKTVEVRFSSALLCPAAISSSLTSSADGTAVVLHHGSQGCASFPVATPTTMIPLTRQRC